MKKFIGIFTIAFAGIFIAPDAEARGHRDRAHREEYRGHHHHRHHRHHRHVAPRRHYVKYHSHCHGPAWVETYVAYYSYGRPVYRSRVIPVRHYAPAPSGHFSISFSGRL